MLLDIKLVKSDPMFCVESVAASVATWLNRNYEMMFAGIWGFDILPENEESLGVIGPRTTAGFTDEDMIQLLKIYHGLQINTHKIERVDILVPIIMGELAKGRPVAISFDEPFLSRPDQKNRFKGFLLIIGYDGQEGFHCIDIRNNFTDGKPFSANRLLKLNEDLNSYSYHYYYTFSIVSDERKAINYDDFRFWLRNCKSLGNKNNPFQSMRYFAGFIRERLDYDLEKNGAESLYSVPLLYNVMHLARARKLIAISVDYLWKKSKNPLLYHLSMDFLKMGYEWNQVWNMLFKVFYLSKDYNRLRMKIADKITEIAEKEESLITRIVRNEYNYFDNISAIRKKDSIESNGNHNILFLDIKSYLNNKAFAGSEPNGEEADFTGQGEFFINHGLLDDDIINAAGMMFTINRNDIQFDNIACSGQTIDIPNGNYQQIMFLGCSERGDGWGELKIVYRNGWVEKKLLHMPDWGQNKSTDAIRAWQGKIMGHNHCKDERSLFAASFLVNFNKGEIKEIQLPNTSNMYIFAISLERHR